MDASKKGINDIFNGNRILEIPFFQRSYVWNDIQWERLLEDMEMISQAKKPYFLGSVILKQQMTSTESIVGDKRTLIDGQQRLTTLNIFFKVLCLKNDENHIFQRMFELVDGNLALWHNYNDISSFKKVLELTSLEEVEGNSSIIKAYRFFSNKVDINKLDLHAILKNIMFVGIDLGVDEDEQQIFDTINSLGVKLTTAELLKNYFFSRDQPEDFSRYWKEVFESDEETRNYWDEEITTGRLKRTFIDLFFYSYLQIKVQEKDINVSTKDKLEYSKVETLFESYKNFINTYHLNKTDILVEIKEYAALFRENFDSSISEKEMTSNYGIERINNIIFGLETSTLIPYVLYVLRNNSDTKVITELFAILEAYLMRRMVVKATTKNYNQLFTDSLISNAILTKEDFVDYINKSADKVNFFPSDADLQEGFHNSKLINKQAAGIIYFLESLIRNNDKQSTQLLGLKKYSLEHLMPKKWENNWGMLDKPEDIAERNKKLLTLGNLAIITQSLNASIRDASWKIKVDGKGEKKPGLKHFSGGIETLSPYLELEVWNEQEIQERAEKLFKEAIGTWFVS